MGTGPPGTGPGRSGAPAAGRRARSSTLRAGAVAVTASSGARRLVGVRLVGSFADGALQAALASLFFLSPERAATAGGIAVASLVLVAPFTLVGPWAAEILDRFSRRGVLLLGSVARALLAAATGLAAALGSDAAVVAGVLAYLSVNRLLLAALSASLPRVVRRRDLVAANALVPTAGSAAALLGGAAALGAGSAGASVPAVLTAVALGCLLAAGLARGFAAGALGPGPRADAPDGDRATGPARYAGARARRPGGLGEALDHLSSRPAPALALATLTAHRLAYGVVLVVALLSARNLLTTSAGEAAALLGLALAATGAGAALAAAVTPALVRAVGAGTWVVTCCALGALSALALAVAPGRAVLVGVALVLGVAAQGVKVATDTAVQRGVDDAFRGRVFVLYDLCFNVALVVSTAIAATALPDAGWSRPVLVVAASWWVAVALVRALAGRAISSDRRPPGSPGPPGPPEPRTPAAPTTT